MAECWLPPTGRADRRLGLHPEPGRSLRKGKEQGFPHVAGTHAEEVGAEPAKQGFLSETWCFRTDQRTLQTNPKSITWNTGQNVHSSHTHAHSHIYTYIYTHIHKLTRTLNTHLYTYSHVHIPTQTHTCMHKLIHMYQTHAHTHTDIYTYTRSHLCIHTHPTHTYAHMCTHRNISLTIDHRQSFPFQKVLECSVPDRRLLVSPRTVSVRTVSARMVPELAVIIGEWVKTAWNSSDYESPNAPNPILQSRAVQGSPRCQQWPWPWPWPCLRPQP